MEARFCQGCGAPLPEHSNKCQYCGVSHSGSVPVAYAPYQGAVNSHEIRAYLGNWQREDLYDLCARLNVDHENISGQSKTNWVLNFVLYMDRRGHLATLAAAIGGNPNKFSAHIWAKAKELNVTPEQAYNLLDWLSLDNIEDILFRMGSSYDYFRHETKQQLWMAVIAWAVEKNHFQNLVSHLFACRPDLTRFF
jgi:hypothetical protein